MASVFGHTAVAATAFAFLPKRLRKKSTLFWGVFCSTIPDADVLAFRFGIPYSHMFGHRGITHSIFFSFLLGLFIAWLMRSKKAQTRDFWIHLTYFTFCTLSHALLDACTNGGRGVALWAPWSDERIFLPFQVIQVSPLGATRFFSEWGLEVIKSELFWIGIPCVVVYILQRFTSGTLKKRLHT
jgi:inner membrane protein